MAWLFVVGVSLEVAGVLLVVASLLRQIPSRKRLADTGYTLTGRGPTTESMLEPACTAVGAALLVAGFANQLAAYVVAFRRDALCDTAVRVALIAAAVGYFIAARVVAPMLSARANSHALDERVSTSSVGNGLREKLRYFMAEQRSKPTHK